MAIPVITALKMWVGTLFTKDDWDFNFSQIVSWLSDGNSDLVVNTVKATNGLDLDGAQITNLGTATSGSQAVTLDQATTLLNRTSYYYPFSVASGKVDSDGNAAYLQKDSDTQVKVLAGNVNPDLVCVQSDGTIESVTSNTVLTVPTANGTYHIIKEKGQPITLTGASTKVTISKVAPSNSPAIGDYWLDNSTVPFVGKKYDGGWTDTSITPFCYLGYVTVSSGTATVTIFDYNNNYFDINIKNLDMLMPDYSAGVSATSGTVVPVNAVGYGNGYGSSMQVNGKDVISQTSQGNYEQKVNCQFLIPKETTVFRRSFTYYPLKGELYND